MSDKKKTLGEKLDAILPPEKVEQFVNKTKSIFSELTGGSKKADAKGDEKKSKDTK